MNVYERFRVVMQKQIPKKGFILRCHFYHIFYPEVKQIEIVLFSLVVEDSGWHVSLCLLMILRYRSTEEGCVILQNE